MDIEGRLKQQALIGINQATARLEKIYALEKIDPKTIRSYKQEEKLAVAKENIPLLESCRRIGGGYPLLSLYDNLERLPLPAPLLYHLRKEGWESIQAVLEAARQNHPKILSLPTALQDTLQKALKPWVEKQLSERVTKIDLKAYLRSFKRSLDQIAFLALLSEAHLLAYFEATPYERVQIERLSDGERKHKVDEALGRLTLGEEVQSIFEGLLFEWLEPRGRITTKVELTERIEQESLEKGGGRGFLELLERKKVAPYISHEDKILTFDKSTVDQLTTIKDLLSGLFYRQKMAYDLQQLEKILQRELLPKGELLDTLLLKRYLLLSTSYRLERTGLLSYTVHRSY